MSTVREYDQTDNPDLDPRRIDQIYVQLVSKICGLALSWRFSCERDNVTIQALLARMDQLDNT